MFKRNPFSALHQLRIPSTMGTLGVGILALMATSSFAWSQPLVPDDTEVIITYDVKTLAGINTAWSDFSPVVHGDMIYFTSNREATLNTWGEGNWKKLAYFNIFAAKTSLIKDSVTFERAKPLNRYVNAENHSGPICFNGNGQQVFFTRVDDTGKRKGNNKYKPALYSADIVDGKWENITRLDFCKEEFSYGHPSLSADGQTLFFASDLSGGKGGKDIWFSKRQGDTWSEPVNFQAINTNGDEVFPCFKNDAIYFASSGHAGRGGLDIFVSRKDGSVWSEVENLEGLNSEGDDFGITFEPNGKRGYLSSNRAEGMGKDDIYRFNVIETVVVKTQDLAGQFRYRTLQQDFAEGLKVVLLDDEGNIIQTAYTDAQGKFSFNELPVDGSYTIKLAGNEDVELTIFGEDGVAQGFLMANENGEFTYRKLELDQSGTLALIDETDIDLVKNTGTLSGQFVYEKLAADYPDGLKVYLVDDDGKIIYEGVTDRYGNFEFKDLPLDNNYTIKTNENLKDYTILVYNRKGDVVAELKGNARGEFIYRKLSGDDVRPMTVRDNPDEDVDFLSLKSTIYGQFHYTELPGDFPGGLTINVLNEDGEIVHTGTTDRAGYFRFKNLPLDDNLRFQLANNDDVEMDGPLVLTIIDRYGEKRGTLVKKDDGFFYYEELDQENGSLTAVNLNDVDVLAEIRNKELPKIYFEYNSAFLDEVSAEKLRQIAQILKDNPELKLEIGSHTDARASDEYNLDLSQKRTEGVVKYLLRKGIDLERLTGRWYGETKLVNKCGNNVDCSEEEHSANRRTEFKFE